MAEHARTPGDGPVGDRLQPSLLDRLTDDEPDKTTEATDRVAMTRTRLRHAVLRDLAWLFNATNAESGLDLTAHPHARASTINYGIPALSGTTLSELDFAEIDHALRDAIFAFEPRLLKDSVQVRSVISGEQLSHHNTLGFEVRAKLWSMPYPLELLLRSNLDLETGHVVVQERTGPTG
jgi:type VI secretion system protein ImpF